MCMMAKMDITGKYRQQARIFFLTASTQCEEFWTCRVDIVVDSIPAAASDVYNLQDNTGGLDSQGFGLSSQSSAETTFQPAADVADSPGTGSALPFNQQVNWGCQPFAGVGKRPLVSPGSSPVKQKPRVSHNLSITSCSHV